MQISDQLAGAQPVPTRISSINSTVQADEGVRRLHIADPVLMAATSTAARLHQRLFCEERHDAGDDLSEQRSTDHGLVSKWRQKDKLKTTAVALVLCLNIGVDPPDVIKISPCARLECWVDPLSMQPAKALETIGKNLQAQYERWQPRAKYKMHLDPTMEDVKKLCISCRRTAKNERVLFHYNGHGVPRPTVNGEIWVFNSRYTQYIPLSMYELQTWLGTPCIYVLDCSAAGLIINNFKAMMEQRQQQLALQQQQAAAAGLLSGAAAAGVGLPDPMREIIVLGACGGNELLPQNPDLPADVFTACLTTPIKVALRWFCSRSLLRHDGISKELIDRIPGRQTDRKTPLGELNWIFTAITDTIAWNSLPRALFQKLFRQDLLVASLFRNFLLAERIMAASNCTPVSYPRLPPTHQHPMWQAWDYAAEMCLTQLPKLLADPNAEFVPSNFFSEQLTAFELWLNHGNADKKPPEQLPIVLQVLLSQVHRLRALMLLSRFLDMGSWAVDLALSVGIFPYVLKLLQTTSSDLRSTLVFIWAKILALDRSCQADLVKDNGHLYFLKYLESPEASITNQHRAQAVFVLAVVCDHHPKGQALCYAANLLQVLLKWMRAMLPVLTASADNFMLVKWLCICLGKLVDNQPEFAKAAFDEGAADLLAGLLPSHSPELRAAAVFSIGSLIHSLPGRTQAPDSAAAGGAAAGGGPVEQLQYVELVVGSYLAKGNIVSDASPLVRGELAVAYGRMVRGAGSVLSEAVYLMQDTIAQQQRKQLELLRRQQLYQQQQQQRQAAAEEAANAISNSIGRSTSSIGAVPEPAAAVGPPSEFTAVPAAPHGQQQQQQQNGSWGSAGSGGSLNPKGSWKGDVLGGSASDLSPGKLSGWAAELDGATENPVSVGNVSDSTMLLYMVLEQILLLATDPAMKVAKLGRQVLALAGLDLAPATPIITPRGSTAAATAGSTAINQPLSTSAGSAAQAPQASLAGSSGVGSSLGSLTQKFVKSSRSWRSGFSGAPSGRLAAPSISTAASSSIDPPSPSRGDGSSNAGLTAAVVSNCTGQLPMMYSRAPYILRSTSTILQQQPSAGMDAATAGGLVGSSSAASFGSLRQAGSMGLGMGGTGEASGLVGAGGSAGSLDPSRSGSVQQLAGDDAGGLLPELPVSQLVKHCYEEFSRPIDEALKSAWRDLEGVKVAPWTATPDKMRKAQRSKEMEAARLRCRSATSPKIREQVNAIETGAEALTAVVFHSFHLLLISVDNKGYVRVNNGQDGNLLNAFHISNGVSLGSGPSSAAEQQPYLDPAASSTAAVTYARQLNEAESNLLLTGAADGAVRIWRSYLNQGLQRLASAWQAVPIRQPPAPLSQAAAYALTASGPPLLYAVGGCHPDVLQCWDLTSEVVMQQIAVRSSPSSLGCPVAVDRLSSAQTDPRLLLTSCSDGFLRLFDLRASLTPVATVHAGKGGLAGMVLEPCGKPGTIITGTCMGSINIMDIRMTSDADATLTSRTAAGAGSNPHAAVDAAGSSQQGIMEQLSCSVVRSVEAHSKGGMSVMVAHPNAPLLATGTTSQVVKVWTDTGDVVGAIRTQSSCVQHKMGPVTCMAWHPYNLYLGAAGSDSVASVYIVDNVPSANANTGVAYAPTTVSSVSGFAMGGAASGQLQPQASMLSSSTGV